MPMPETSIHEHARPILSQYHIRLPWQSGMINPIANPTTPQESSDNHFRLCVLAFAAMLLCRCEEESLSLIGDFNAFGGFFQIAL